MVTSLDEMRLRRAGEARRKAVSEYGAALRTGKVRSVVDRLAKTCRATDADLTRTLAPFLGKNDKAEPREVAPNEDKPHRCPECHRVAACVWDAPPNRQRTSKRAHSERARLR